MISDSILAEVFQTCKKYSAIFYRMSDAIGLLDFLLSLTSYSFSTKTVKPIFTDTLALKNGRHPIRDVFDSNLKSNNVYCCEDLSFQLIGGSNLSGKTTYLKQIGLLQIMVT